MRAVASSFVVAVVVIVVAGSGCGAATVDFDVPVRAETRLEGAGLVDQVLGSVGFADLENVDFETTQEFKNNDVRREQVVDARVTVLNLSITSPQGANFDWLNSIAFTAAAAGEDSVAIASATVDDGEAAVACDVESVDVGPLVRAPKLEITTETDARAPPNDTTVQVDVNFHIRAEVL